MGDLCDFLRSKKHLVEDLLPHFHQLMKNLGLEGGVTPDYARPETTQYIMLCDLLPNALVNCPQHSLPQDLYDPDASVISIPL